MDQAMLSIYTLKSAAKASNYYQAENYYANGATPFQGQWFGKGAEVLGLSGNATLDQFEQVLLGKLSPDIWMKNTREGKYHRPGYDLTFSAPKSVSILATVLGEESLLLAHRVAVQKVLTHIEKEYAITRVKEEECGFEKTGNLIFSIFEHNDSRALDPELHSHAVLANATQRENGEWRTLDSYRIYKDKILLGMYYRAYLVKELMQLGFEIVQTSDQGTFELKDFPPQLIKQFSKRREQIKKELAETGYAGGSAAKVANFNTRPPKKHVEPEHLRLAWAVELNQCGYSLEWLEGYISAAKERGPIVPPNPEKLASEALNNAISHLSEWQGVFTLQDLKKTALGLSILSHSDAVLEKAIVEHLETGDLRYLGENNFTTQTARDLETQNAETMRSGKKQVAPIFGKLSAKYISNQFFKTPNEKKVFESLLTCKDKEIVLNYTRKNDFNAALTPYIQLVRQYYLYPTLLSQSAVRAKALGQATGTEFSRTIAGFLMSLEKRVKKTPQPKSLYQLQQGREIWIVDGESEVGLSQVSQLQSYAAHFGARIIWGKAAFKKTAAIQSLIQHGVHQVTSVKQSQEKIFEDLTQNLNPLLQALKQNQQLIEVSDGKQREALIVEKYLQLPENASIWAYSKAECNALNQQIRTALKATGSLNGVELKVQTLEAIKLTKAQRSLAKFYQLNDLIYIRKENSTLGIAANTYLTVKDIQLQSKTLTLIDDTGKEIRLPLNQKNVHHLQLYRLDTKTLQVGDSIAWNQTIRNPENRSLDRLSGEKAKVIGIEGQQITVELRNKNVVTLEPNSHKKDAHWDYGYAVNHRQVEMEGSPLIVVLNSKAERLYEVFAQSLMNAEKDVYIFCDDLSKVEERLLHHAPLLALDKPVTRYEPSTENNVKKHIQECFPKYTARLEGYFVEHRQLLETLMQEYEKEKPVLSGLTFEVMQSLQKSVEETSAALPKPSLSTAQKEAPTQSEMAAIRQSQVIEACQAIDWLCAKYAEREAVFDLSKLQAELFKMVGLKVPVEILTEQCQFALDQGILLPISEETVFKKDGVEKKILVATREMVALEKACLYVVEKSQNVLSPVMKPEEVAQSLKASQKLTEGQKSALELILTTQDRVVGVQGVAGVGKTTLLKTLNREARSVGYELLGLSNSTAARQRLQTGSQDLSSEEAFLKSGIKSLTTRKFLMSAEKLLKQDETLARLEYGGNKILILDESSFTSTRELFALVNVIKKLDIRLALLGDYAQLNSVEAGRIFYLLLGSSMKSFALTENVRFKSLKALQTMQLIYKEQIGDALQNLGSCLVEIPDREERLEYIAKWYLEKAREAQANSLIITPLHKDRRWVNQLIHAGLKDKGVLKGSEIETVILAPVNITEVEKQRIYSFKEDQWIRFNQSGLNINIKAGEYCKVLQKNYTDQTLLLERVNGEQLYWSPERHIRQDMGALEVYQVEKLKVMAGEQIRWLKNDEKRGIRNGETALVLSVTEQQMQVQLMDGTEQSLDLSCKPDQHWDYAYAATTYIAQGDNKLDTLFHGLGGSENAGELLKTTSIEEFLVGVTRGDNVTAVLDNIATYQHTLYAKLNLKRSTQEYLDPNRDLVKAKVRKMTENVTGRAEKKASKTKADPSTAILAEKPTRYPASKDLNQVKKSDKKSFIAQERVNAYLERDILGYVSKWLGEPRKKSGNEARWEGTITVNFKGTKAGWWKCWSGNDGGKDLISLYAFHYKISWYEALQELAENFGLKPEESLFKTKKSETAKAKRLEEQAAKAQQKAKLITKDEAERIKQALDCYNRSIAITNTVAEKYLRTTRGISAKLPDDFRFCARIKHKDTQEWIPALVVPVRNSKGEIQGITRIFLDKVGEKLNTTYIDELGRKKKAADKLSLGVFNQTEVIVNKGHNSETVYITEGVETALSVRDALPQYKIVATLSASRLYDIPLSPETKRVVICADEDGPNASSNKSVIEAVNAYMAKGMQVEIAYPRRLPVLEKTDFNDLSKAMGVRAVKEDFEKTIRINTIKPLSVSDLLHLKNELQKTKNTLSRPHYQSKPREQER